MIICLDIICEPVCFYNGSSFSEGDKIEAIDGCNTCVCEGNGSVSCTEKVCACDPDAEWNRDYISNDLLTCASIDFACPENTEYFSTTCGCGCEQSAKCPQYINCMPGPPHPGDEQNDPQKLPCDSTELAEVCPYTEIAE
jgi:hypothetical protein